MIIKPVKTISVLFLCFFCFAAGAEEQKNLFKTYNEKKDFAEEISFLIGKAWKSWQESVVIDGINVEGSHGILVPGSLNSRSMRAEDMLEHFNRNGRSQNYIKSVKAVSDALENGMRSWQRGYGCDNILFPQGASCSYTLSPCENIPIRISSGHSLGDKNMTEDELYNYILYRLPKADKSELVVFRAIAGAVSDCFIRWKKTCNISGIVASGGIAPTPAPIGTGPGPVRGAKGNGGRLKGPYITSEMLYEKIVAYLASGDRRPADG